MLDTSVNGTLNLNFTIIEENIYICMYSFKKTKGYYYFIKYHINKCVLYIKTLMINIMVNYTINIKTLFIKCLTVGTMIINTMMIF